MNVTDSSAADLFPIRAVAEATGIAPATLRAWERRYGRPVPVRLPSGHRRYTEDQVRWLRRVSEALADGHRPSDVVPASRDRLDTLLDRPSAGEGRDQTVRELLALVRDFEAVALERALERSAATVSPAAFLDGVAAPFLNAVGQCWADGELDVRHEHFATGVLESVVRSVRDRLPPVGPGRPLVLATLPEDLHALPLRMAELLVRAHGIASAYLGANTPLGEIVATAGESGARGALVTVTAATAGVATDRVLASLREQLPEPLHLLVGGSSARRGRRGPRGVHYFDDFHTFDQWLTIHGQEFRS